MRKEKEKTLVILKHHHHVTYITSTPAEILEDDPLHQRFLAAVDLTGRSGDCLDNEISKLINKIREIDSTCDENMNVKQVVELIEKIHPRGGLSLEQTALRLMGLAFALGEKAQSSD